MSHDAEPRRHFFAVTLLDPGERGRGYVSFTFDQPGRAINQEALDRMLAESGLDHAVLINLTHLGRMTQSEFNQP